MSTRWTPADTFRHERIIQRSRFLAIAVPVSGTDAALAAIGNVGTAEATHNCWAWRIGDSYRFNDDGEPGGTAGRPILAAIDGADADRVVVVVTRWFGGIKLGAGGLVRAYGGTAAECLRLAPRQPIVETVQLRCAVDFALERPLRGLLPALAGEVVAQDYDGDGVVLTIRLPQSGEAAFREAASDLSRGQARFLPDP
jgi:uncharacterized YigZ family protein